MKKIILTGVSAVLVIVCLIMCASGNGVRVGAGFGFGDSIEEPEDLLDLLDFVSGGGNMKGVSARAYSEDEMFQNLALSDDEEDRENKYTSVTVEVESNASVSGISSVNRNLQMYITEDGTFYRSKGDVSSESASSGTALMSGSMFDMDIYKTNDGDVYCYFREFYTVNNYQSIQIRNEYKKKWIELPSEVSSFVLSVDSQNMGILSTMRDIILVLIEDGRFENEDSVKIDEEELSTILAKNESHYLSFGGYEVDFRVDLSSEDIPSIYLGLYSDDEFDSKADSGATDIITFSNINNTVISFDKSDVDIFAKDFDSSEDIFLKKREK